MTTKQDHVLLITDDAELRKRVRFHKPPSADLRCTRPASRPGPIAADELWIDLDSVKIPPDDPARRRVYFYSRLPKSPERLPDGLFIKKPCGLPVLALLWAGVEIEPALRVQPPLSADLPSWLIDLMELDLRDLCHACVTQLPERFGYSEIALYLYQAKQQLLTLAETDSEHSVDLAVRVGQSQQHAFSRVAQSATLLLADDILKTCDARGWIAPQINPRAKDRSTLIAPMIHRGELQGIVLLTGRSDATEPARTPPMREVFSFLARCTQHARLYEKACTDARVDALTGLFNYRWMHESLDREIRRAARFGQGFSVVMLDLDNLKAINDCLGHTAGDEALRFVAQNVRRALRQLDSAARMGGDEFLILLPATDEAGAQRAAKRVIEFLSDGGPYIAGEIRPVTAGIGIAQWQPGQNIKQLLNAVDQAMYTTKRGDRTRTGFHPDAHQPTGIPTTDALV